jgi:hypothetical protein
MRPAGWERYCQRREEAAHRDQAITASPEFATHMGVAGYLGACNLDGRLLLRQHGHGARLTQMVIESGRSLELARLWRCETAEEARALERKLKEVHDYGPALCPICQGLPLDVYTSMRQGHYALAWRSQVGRRRAMPVTGTAPRRWNSRVYCN